MARAHRDRARVLGVEREAQRPQLGYTDGRQLRQTEAIPLGDGTPRLGRSAEPRHHLPVIAVAGATAPYHDAAEADEGLVP